MCFGIHPFYVERTFINSQMIEMSSASSSSDDDRVIRSIKSNSESVPEVESSDAEEVKSPSSDDAEVQSISDPEEEEKEIETIIDHRPKGGTVQYLVRYKNFPKFANEWIDEGKLADKSDLILEYLNGSTYIPPQKVKFDFRKNKFEITGAFIKKDKTYYNVLFDNGDESSISSKKLKILDPIKLIHYLEEYVVLNDKVDIVSE
ncbi:hypothetical protein TRFO_25858 [Tritrichomonas foetus]|uniref:Chromo domain-containing protein n=1 Tax=Tritrichomonas foetus TaxID=1144522 RepID=A0A1J4K8X2_9EUKA|nr:hypothetical protein TRFO_25858 [Tritrichomonas foetus]|eukprot:OHT06164.1 hypothetical protein TRFO_25858 [Tritrichomonas foetus]